jgi:hypothetical protein
MSFSINSFSEQFPISGNISETIKNDYTYFKHFNTYEEANKHVVAIRVYYNDLKYTLFSQEPKTEMFNFISNIGGILGLFLGLSFLSFIEIFEIVFEILSIIFFRK